MEEVLVCISIEAGTDLSSGQYRFVTTSTGKLAFSADDGDAIGILQNAPASGEMGRVAISGVSKLKMNASAGVTVDGLVSSAANGLGKVGDSGARVLGKALTTGAASEVIRCLLRVQGYPSVA